MQVAAWVAAHFPLHAGTILARNGLSFALAQLLVAMANDANCKCSFGPDANDVTLL